MQKRNIVLMLGLTLLLTILLFNSNNVCGAEIEYKDSKEDLYRISILDFLYIVGDEFPDRPNSVSDITDVLEKMVVRSVPSTTPGSADIRDVYINTNDVNYTAVIVEMEDDIRDLDYLMVIVVLEHSHNNWVELEMEWDEADGASYEWSSENWEGNDTVGGINDNQIGIAFPRSECNYQEDDDFIVISYTFSGDFNDPFQSMFYYDYCPNEEVDVQEQGAYQGSDFITMYLSQLAQFLFGWFFIGYVPFLVLIVLVLALFQFFSDRRSRIIHYTGMVLLLLCTIPIIFYSVSLDFFGMLGVVDIFAILTLVTLMSFLIFIVTSTFSKYIKRLYLVFYGAGCGSLFSLQLIYTILYAGTLIWSLIILTIGLSLICIGLIISNMNKRLRTGGK